MLENKERNAEIYDLSIFKKRSTGALAEQFGLSAPRVSQIVHHVGQQRHGAVLTIKELREIELAQPGTEVD